MILIEFYGMDVNGSDRDMGPILLNPEDISAVVSVPGGPGYPSGMRSIIQRRNGLGAFYVTQTVRMIDAMVHNAPPSISP
jgi:hypothetical protein